MDSETLKEKAAALYDSGCGYIKIAAELGISRSKVRRLLGKLDSGDGGKGFRPWKIHVPLGLALLSVFADTQMRVAIDGNVVEEYAEAMRGGAEFPAVSVFTNGLSYWLADGFHRYHAAREAGAENITADIYKGTLRDAKLYAMGANANHGLRRTNADKRRAVEIALADEEWRELPNTEIAKMCAVAESFVRKIKAECEPQKIAQCDTPETAQEEDSSPEPENEPPVRKTESAGGFAGAISTVRGEKPSDPRYGYFLSFHHKTQRLIISTAQGTVFDFSSRGELSAFIKALEGQLSSWGGSDKEGF